MSKLDSTIALITQEVKRISHTLRHKKAQSQLKISFVIGLNGSGKTSLLSKAHLTEHFSQDEAGNSLSLWQHGQHLFIELIDEFFLDNANAVACLLHRIKQCSRQLAFHSLLLCLDTDRINQLALDDIKTYIDSNLTQLQWFKQCLSHPLHLCILFTKMDSLAGFCDFFEQEQESNPQPALGYSLNWRLNANGLKKVNRKKHAYLVKSLHQKTIKKLHATRSSIKRHLIREFPLQLEQLARVFSLFYQIPECCRLSGIYYTSARQQTSVTDHFNSKVQHQFALTLTNSYSQISNDKPFFVTPCLQDIIQLSLLPDTKNRHTLHKTKLSSAIALGLSLSWITYQYFNSSHKLDIANSELNQFERLIQSPAQLNEALLHLHKAEQSMAHASTMLPYNQLNRLKQHLHSNYKNLLTHQFLPTIAKQLTAVMNSPQASIPERYHALKTYRMLTNPHRLDYQKVHHWFTLTWHELPEKPRQKNLNLLRQALAQPFQPIPANKLTLTMALNTLNAIPPGYLYYNLLKKDLAQKLETHTIDGFNTPLAKIPTAFTRKQFTNIVSEVIPAKVKTFISERWILSDTPGLSEAALTQLLIEQYSSDYTQWWRNAMRHTQPLAYNNYQQAGQQLRQINQTQSITQILNLIKENTKPNTGNAENLNLFNQKIATQFTGINLLSHSNIEQIQRTYSELADFFSTLTLVNDRGATAFNITRALFENQSAADPIATLFYQAKQLPYPISEWFKESANNAWYLILIEAKQYINRQWNNRVYQYYQAHVSHRFPFGDLERPEMSLDEFEQFFAPGGRLNQFFQTYMQPFLNTDSAEWTPKQVNGLIMPIRATAITELTRANVIRNMFFQYSNSKMNVHFKLQKLVLDPIIAQFGLNIGGTQIIDNQDSNSQTDFNWPSNDVSLDIYAVDGQHYSFQEEGPWAWFKLLERLNISTNGDDTRQFELLFDLEGNAGKYALITDTPINPFIPGLLKEFKLENRVF